MLEHNTISYEYRLYFYYSIDIYDILFHAFSEMRYHFDFHINTDFTTSKDNCDYIIIKHITTPFCYISNENKKKIFYDYNKKYYTAQIKFYDDKNHKYFDDIDKYQQIFYASKCKISSETFMIDDTNKIGFDNDKILCDLIELNEEDKTLLEKVLSSNILKPYICNHGFVVRSYNVYD